MKRRIRRGNGSRLGTSPLLLDTPANNLGVLFNNKTSTVGDTVSLGSFTEGPTLVEFEDLFGNPEGSGGFNDLFFSFTNVVAPPSLTESSGYKFEDLNGNEIDDGEPRLAGVEITLDGGVNPPFTVLTDQSGEYSFVGVPDGTYTVTETVPDGFISTTLKPGPITISNGHVVSTRLVSVVEISSHVPETAIAWETKFFGW